MTAGALLSHRWWIGGGVTTWATRDVVTDPVTGEILDFDVLSLRDFTAEASAAWGPTGKGRVAPVVGIAAGAAAHSWTELGVPDRTSVSLAARLDLGLALPIVPDDARIALVPLLQVGVDLGPTTVGTTSGVPAVLSPLQAGVGLTLRTRMGAE